MTLVIDHLMWGAPDLDRGIAQAQTIFSAAAARGGAHPGLGTRNALLGLGERVYLEIIAPDPDQDLRGTLGERLQALDACALVTWAVACNDLAKVAAAAARLPLSVLGPIRTRRKTPSGDVLEWELLFVGGHEFPGLVPFFIDWRETPHPAAQNPHGGEFLDLTLRSPQPTELTVLLDGLGVAASVERAADPGLEARIRVGGDVTTLTSSPQTRGLSFQPTSR